MKIKVAGLREIEQALMEFPKATARNVLVRVLKKRGQIFADDMRPRVRVDKGDLRDSIGVGTKLTKRQSKLNRKQSPVEVYAGAGGLTQAVTEEFGTSDQAPHPSARPAWDATKNQMLDGITDDLKTEVEKARVRAARKAAKWKKP